MKTLAHGGMFDSRFVRRSAWVIGLAAAALATGLWATSSSQDSASSPETAAKPLTPKEQKRQVQKLRREQAGPWKKWLTQDVAYIITDEEKSAFKRLQADEERQQFVDQFWLRRDPTPDTVENEYKEEHYRRIGYANYVYASGIPGWKTDRGMIYITFGPPDEIDSHPSGQPSPFEDWRYRYIEGVGNDIMIEFVDTRLNGEYHMTDR